MPYTFKINEVIQLSPLEFRERPIQNWDHPLYSVLDEFFKVLDNAERRRVSALYAMTDIFCPECNNKFVGEAAFYPVWFRCNIIKCSIGEYKIYR